MSNLKGACNLKNKTKNRFLSFNISCIILFEHFAADCKLAGINIGTFKDGCNGSQLEKVGDVQLQFGNECASVMYT